MERPAATQSEAFGPATRFVPLPDGFTMRSGATLDGARVAFETWGEPSADRDNAVLILTGLSPDAHAASCDTDPRRGWWENLVGPGKPIDSHRYFIICVNSLGSCKGSTGPASARPGSDESYRLAFPELHLEDVAHAARAVVQSLDIDRLHMVIGPSMGGFSAMAYAMLYPGETRHASLISTATRATPTAIALHSLQREMIRTDPAWRNGDYSPDAKPAVGMRLARKLGMITYRSGDEWLYRFNRDRIPDDRRGREPFGMEFEIESYLQLHAERFVESFDPNCYLYLSRAMDLFDVAEHGDSVSAGLKRMRLESAQVIGVESDDLFPPWQQAELARELEFAGVTVRSATLPSIQGHDSFLVDTERFGRELAAYLRHTESG